jgi:hypothetical protein
MKYKVGDRVRMSGGDVVTIKELFTILYTNMFWAREVEHVFLIRDISQLIISEITDELIDRFKKEKIAWHFKSKEDYEKALDILAKKNIIFSNGNVGNEYFDIYKDFCISYWGGLGYGDLGYHKSKGYEIIEIMKPVYVPSISRFIFDNFITADRPQYRGIDCEVMYQKFKNVVDLEEKVRNQKVEIKNLHNKIEEMQKTLSYEMNYGKSLAKENVALKHANSLSYAKTIVLERKLEKLRELLNED